MGHGRVLRPYSAKRWLVSAVASLGIADVSVCGIVPRPHRLSHRRRDTAAPPSYPASRPLLHSLSPLPLRTHTRARRFLASAKQHYFMDADMSEVIEEDAHEMTNLGSGCKVVVTIGPASHSVETLTQLLTHGMSCARLDLTWGTMKFHSDTLKNLAEAMRVTRKLCAVWMDTSGREIVVKRPNQINDDGWVCLDQTPISYAKGSEVVITTRDDVDDCSPSLLPITVKALPGLVHKGQRLQVGRYMSTGAEGGSLMLEVASVTSDEIKCVALNDASLAGTLIILVSHRETSLENHSEDLNKELPLFTQGDKEMIAAMGKKYEIDYVSLSYCNSSHDVVQARDLLDSLGLEQTKIVAKIERKAAVHNFEDIIAIADGILFSRGNLGLDFEPEEMFHLQKKCILRCNAIARPIILTRFVDTMVNTPRPTRAEATDVANAVLDGCDGVMLGAETLRGLYPVETVDTVAKLCRSAERYFDYRAHHEQLMGEAFDDESSLMDGRNHNESFGNLNMAHLHSFGSYARNETLKIRTKSGDFESITEGGASEPASFDDILSPSLLEPVEPSDMTKVSSFGVIPVPRGDSPKPAEHVGYMSKVESIASSAVRSAEKINAGLIIVFAQSGRTASLVSKYRPPMPVVSVVVPTLQSNKLGWRLEGKYLARQCLIMRGITPLMAAPMSAGHGGLLEEAVAASCKEGLCKANDYAVAILSEQGNFVVKVVKVNSTGDGILPFSEGGDSFFLGEQSCTTEAMRTLGAVPSFATPPTSPKFAQ